MNTQIAFVTGKPLPFIATRTFALGNSNVSVPAGSEVLFDGTMVQYAGQNISMPQLRGAIRIGWLVPSDNYDPDDMSAQIPQPAGIQLRHSTQGGNPLDPSNHARPVAPVTTDEQEQEVGDVRAMADAAQQRNRDRTYRVGTENRALSAVEAQRLVVEPQDGVPVRSLKTPAKNATTLTGESAGSTIRQANQAGVIDPGQGVTEAEYLARMTPVQRAEYLARKEAERGKYVNVDPTVSRQVVGTLPQQQVRQTEGFTVTGAVGGGIETVDLGGTGGAGKAQESVVESEGISFRNTNGPKKDVRPVQAAQPPQEEPINIQGTEDARRKIAKVMCPDFPDLYNFDDPIRKKIARIQADFDDRPDVIRAIFAAEMDEMKQRILQNFPDCF